MFKNNKKCFKMIRNNYRKKITMIKGQKNWEKLVFCS